MSNISITESIFNSMKQMLGLEPEYTPFDVDIIVHINTVLGKLAQVGVGPSEGIQLNLIEPETTLWTELIGTEDQKLNMVKTYMYLSLRLLFDPPQSSSVLSAMQVEADELLWRLNVAVDKFPANHEGEEEED